MHSFAPRPRCPLRSWWFMLNSQINHLTAETARNPQAKQGDSKVARLRLEEAMAEAREVDRIDREMKLAKRQAEQQWV